MSSNTISVRVVEGRALKAADIGGTSDPYFTIRLISKSYGKVFNRNPNPTRRSKIVKKTLCPRWDEEFSL